jgi:hypothetical protein
MEDVKSFISKSSGFSFFIDLRPSVEPWKLLVDAFGLGLMASWRIS